MAKALAQSSSFIEATTTRKDALSSLVTIVIVTSPIESNPSTELLDRCLFSIVRTWPALSDCPIVVAADGCYEEKDDDNEDDNNESSKMSNRRRRRKRVFGRATTSQLRQYNEYLDRLESRKWMIVDRPTKIVDDDGGDSGRLLYSSHWLGFALTLQKAIQNHVRTPLVFVSPHDYEIITESLADVCVQSLIRAILDTSLDNKPDNNKSNNDHQRQHPINYIGLHNAKTLSLRQRNSAVLQDLPLIEIENTGNDDDNDNLNMMTTTTKTKLLLTPLASWKENPHFASVEAYHDVVFHNKLNHKFKRGHFIEDTLGQKMLQTLKDCSTQQKKKQDIFASYGTFLLEVIKKSQTEAAPAPAPDTGTTTTTTTTSSSIGVSPPEQQRQQRPCTYHINGINYIDTDQRILRGYAPPKSFQLERAVAAKEHMKRRDVDDNVQT